MKTPVNLLIVILLLWMSSSTYYYVCKIKGFCNESANTSITIIDTDEPETIENEIIVPVKEIDMDNKTVYFGFGKNSLTLDNNLKTYISELNLFMQEHKNHSIILIGHTDTIGSEDVNHLMGLERAEFVKKMLIEAGIQTNQIKTESKGENEAFTSDDTEEGRSKDRRVEIITK